jgi:hypothetical protein
LRWSTGRAIAYQYRHHQSTKTPWHGCEAPESIWYGDNPILGISMQMEGNHLHQYCNMGIHSVACYL